MLRFLQAYTVRKLCWPSRALSQHVLASWVTYVGMFLGTCSSQAKSCAYSITFSRVADVFMDRGLSSPILLRKVVNPSRCPRVRRAVGLGDLTTVADGFDAARVSPASRERVSVTRTACGWCNSYDYFCW